MQIELEPSLRRWIDAQLLDPEQAGRIRDFETHAPQHRARLPVLIGLTFGGVMLAAGLLLFVSAHWEEMSPALRMSLLVCAVAALHAGAAWCSGRFQALATTLHAVGTISLGGAIALAGQIFNMQEHWPSAILLWAIGAATGWLLLRDWPHFALIAILFPVWLTGEWTEAVPQTSQAIQVVTAGWCLLLICYLSVSSALTRSLNWIGGIGLLPAVIIVGVARWNGNPATGAGLMALGWSGAILLPLAFAYIYRRNRAWMNAVAAIWVAVLSLISGPKLEIWTYLWCAIGAAGLIAWGIDEHRAERVNLGMAGFALTLLFFLFSSVMDKLGRSASLIAMGIVFLAGGWFWEKLRRRLVDRAQPGGAQ